MFWWKLKRDWLVQSIVLLTQCLCSFILSLQDSVRLGKGWNIYCLLALWTMLIQLYLSYYHLTHCWRSVGMQVDPGHGSWNAVKGLALSSCLTHLCEPGAWQPEQPKALDIPDVVSSGSEGVAGKAEFRMSSGWVLGRCVDQVCSFSKSHQGFGALPGLHRVLEMT